MSTSLLTVKQSESVRGAVSPLTKTSSAALALNIKINKVWP